MHIKYLYEFGVSIKPAPGIFHSSKIIYFTPRFVFKNESDYYIAVA